MRGENIMTWDSDYAYIQVFIDFLNQIINMIKGLFSGSSTKTEEDNEEENA